MHQINPLLLGLGNIFESLAKGVPLTSSATSQAIGCFQQLDSKSLLLLNTILTYIIKQRNQAAAQPEASPLLTSLHDASRYSSCYQRGKVKPPAATSINPRHLQQQPAGRRHWCQSSTSIVRTTFTVLI